jgi:hypothetical protein
MFLFTQEEKHVWIGHIFFLLNIGLKDIKNQAQSLPEYFLNETKVEVF